MEIECNGMEMEWSAVAEEGTRRRWMMIYYIHPLAHSTAPRLPKSVAYVVCTPVLFFESLASPSECQRVSFFFSSYELLLLFDIRAAGGDK